MGPSPAVAAVRLAVRRALADLGPGATVLVACSGGADSLALSAALLFETRRAGLEGGGVTVDHGLQAGSAAQAERVAATLTALGLAPVRSVRVEVGTAGGPEAAARTARYAALDAVAEDEHADAVLLGHTLDDQAETVLLGLARGAGPRSLAGMAPKAGRYRRPLLALGRATTVAACRDEGLEPWDDPHNDDRAFARVRVRREALPALEDAIGPGVAAALARTARLARADADALDSWATDAARMCCDPAGDLVVSALAALPAAVRWRVLRAAAVEAGCRPSELALGHVDALDELVVGWHGQGPLHLPGHVRATRADGLLRLRPAPGHPPPRADHPDPAAGPPRVRPVSGSA